MKKKFPSDSVIEKSGVHWKKRRRVTPVQADTHL